MIIPEHLQIETINGVCTARCTMCAFKSWTRKPYTMTQEEFKIILGKFAPYRGTLKYLSLFGFGEPLLDDGLKDKIRFAKFMSFRSVGIATNCTELTAWRSRELLDAGLDTIICSVDGFTKKVHESIRVGTNFEKVVANILGFISIRRYYGAKVIIRFVRQRANQHEWGKFYDYWMERIDPSYGDAVLSLDVVDCDGKVAEYGDKDVLKGVGIPCYCEQLYNRMLVLSNGDVALCCGDDAGKFNIGNVLKDEPMEIYNGEVFTRYREMIKDGRIGELELCNTCTIPRSMMLKDKVEE